MQAAPGMPEAVSDAPAGNWVDRYAPPALRPWLRLSRADRPIGTWLLLIPCWWGVGLAMMADRPRWFDLWIAIACAAGAFVMRGAGCTWNDITDRDIDARVERTRSRPLPSGQVTLAGAYGWMALQAAVGLAILISLGRAAIWMGVLSLVAVAVYPFAKRFTWWPQVFLGIAFNWGVMLAWAAHAGSVGPVPVIAWLAGICWTVFYDTIYAHQDIDDDERIGVKSTARLFGDHTPVWLWRFGATAVALLAMAIMATRDGLGQQLLAFTGLAGFAAHLVWQIGEFNTESDHKSPRLFRSNRDAGLILALFLAGAGVV